MTSRRPGLLCCLLLLICLLPFSSLNAQEERSYQFTEDLSKIWNHYQNAQYAEVNDRVAAFIEQYQTTPNFKDVIKRLHYLDTMAAARIQNWPQTTVSAESFLTTDGIVSDTWNEEVLFWKGLAHSRNNQYGDAKHTLEYFLTRFPESPKKLTAQFVIGQCFLKMEDYAGADQHFETMRSSIQGPSWGKALLLQLTALIKANQPERAATVIGQGFERLEEVPQVAALQLLAMQVSRQFNSQQEYRKAISLLMYVLPREKIDAAQNQQLQSLKQQLEQITAEDPESAEIPETTRLIKTIEAEKTRLASIKNFDAMIQFQIASAWLGLQRYRETAYTLERMIRELPVNPISETAVDTLIKCYAEIQRWPKVIETAQYFESKYPQSAALPGVMLLKGQARMEVDDFDAAMQDFATLAERYPQHDLSAHAMFLQGYCQSLQGDFAAAQGLFRSLIEKYPQHERAEAAAYWIGNTQSMNSDYQASIASMEQYLQQYPDGRHAADARYRIAFALHAMGEFERSIPMLESFVAEYPDTADGAEALLLLGDAKFAEADIEGGIALFRQVPKGIQNYAEEAWFRIGKAYRLNRENENMRRHFIEFQQEFPQSARISEAVYWVGRSFENEPDKTRVVYQEAMEQHGNNTRQWGITEIIAGYQQLLTDDTARKDYQQQMTALAERAASRGQDTLTARSHYALGLLARQESAAQAYPHMAQALKTIDIKNENPLLLVDIAEVLRETAHTATAQELFKDIRRWNPTTPSRDRIYSALGEMALAQSNDVEAMEWFQRFLKETPGSRLRSPVVMHVAKLEAKQGNHEVALALLESLLQEKSASRPLKVEAMLTIGNIHLEAGSPKLAFPYFQRIYVMYGAYQDAAAAAYLQSALALERLNDPTGAARTYMEFLDQREFFGNDYAPQFASAQKNLDQLPEQSKQEARERIKAAAEALAATTAGGTS